MSDGKLLYSMREAARLLGIGRCNTLPDLIRAGKVKTVLIAGRVRIPRAEVERIANEGTDPQPEPPKKRRPVARGERAAESVLAMEII